MSVQVITEEDLRLAMQAEYEAGEKAVTRAMRAAEMSIKRAWRSEIRGAGLGRKLPNTVRSATYPVGDVSMNAAALIWTKAPKIIAAHNSGAVIRARDGQFLAIPLPAAGQGRFGRKLTPLEFERRVGRGLRYVYRRGRASLLVLDDARLTKRARTARRKGGRRRRDGILTGAQTVPIFVLVPQVKLRKRMDLVRVAERIAAGLPGGIIGAWP